MSTQIYNRNAQQTVLPTSVRKDWREIYAQKRAKCSNARCLKTGRTHEDLNEAKHIWRVKAQTEGDTKKDRQMVGGRVSVAVATPDVPHLAPPSKVAYSSAGGLWLMSRGVWGGGLSGARRNAGEMNKARDGYSNYPPRWAANSSVYKAPKIAALQTGSDEFMPRFGSARKMHYRTSSASTASSSSLRTESFADNKSPWAWQWAGADTCRK